MSFVQFDQSRTYDHLKTVLKRYPLHQRYNMTHHTPGPWVARQQFSNLWRIEVPREGFVPLSVAVVSTTVLEVGCNDKDTAANARLIAAAPMMWEALKLISEGEGDAQEIARQTLAVHSLEGAA
jgi:hypothetical protein